MRFLSKFFGRNWITVTVFTLSVFYNSWHPVKIDFLLLWCFLFCCWSSSVACHLPGHHGGKEVVSLGHHSAMPRPSQSSPGSTHFTYIIICTRHSVNASCKLGFCCSFLYIYFASVCPGRGIPPPLWLFRRFLPQTEFRWRVLHSVAAVFLYRDRIAMSLHQQYGNKNSSLQREPKAAITTWMRRKAVRSAASNSNMIIYFVAVGVR